MPINTHAFQDTEQYPHQNSFLVPLPNHISEGNLYSDLLSQLSFTCSRLSYKRDLKYVFVCIQLLLSN